MKRIIICISFIFSILCCSAYADSFSYYSLRQDKEASEQGLSEYTLYDKNGNLVYTPRFGDGFSFFTNALPEKYDSRDYGYITPVRDQLYFGTCWAHSVLACAETSMVKQGFESANINYSEKHLAYFTHKGNNDDMWGFYDGTDVTTSEGYYGGGNSYKAFQILQNRQGSAIEVDYPYPIFDNETIDEAYRYDYHAEIQEHGYLLTDTEAKQAIMEHGAVALSYYVHDNDAYLSDNMGYYQNTETTTNHSVTVVGWDDTYAIENFDPSCRPEAPGAWLVKNSYGKQWGIDGYFWLSYYDTSIDTVSYTKMGPKSNESILHTYQGSDMIYLVDCPAGNVFCAKENQTLTSVGFNSYNTISYKIEIYVGNEEKPSSPIMGEPVQTITGYTPCRTGFFKVDLNETIELTENQYFSVVVYQYDEEENYAMNWVEGGEGYSSNPGETYILDNGVWIDGNVTTDNFKPNNAGIFAYAKPSKYTVKFDTRGGSEMTAQTVEKGGYATVPEAPEREGFEFLGWYENASVSKEWDFDTPVNRDITLYAKWTELSDVSLSTARKYFNNDGGIRLTINASYGDDYRIILKDNDAVYAIPRLNVFNESFSLGITDISDYSIYAQVMGANGEVVETDTIDFKITDKTNIWKYGNTVEATNIPTGAYLILASYDSSGRLTDVKSEKYTSDPQVSNVPDGTKIMLWDADFATPLCESVN